MMRTRPVRPATLVIGLIVAGILILGLVTGLAIDTVLSTRPIATLVFALVAAQLAALVVYRVFVAGLREIAHHSGKPDDSEDT